MNPFENIYSPLEKDSSKHSREKIISQKVRGQGKDASFVERLWGGFSISFDHNPLTIVNVINKLPSRGVIANPALRDEAIS